MSKPFADVIRDYRSGALHEKLTGELTDLVQRVAETNASGELVLKIKVKRDKDQMKLIATSKMTMPAKIEVGDALFFVDPDGGLHRTDPRQGELPIVRDANKHKAN